MTDAVSLFKEKYNGRFVSALRWEQLDALWQTVQNAPQGWYVYFINDAVPQEPMQSQELQVFIREIDELLRRDHDYDYCGIVYTDAFDAPSMIKIYDPNNLGASCGASGQKIHPRWLLTRIAPEEIIDQAPTPMNRKRWWQRFAR